MKRVIHTAATAALLVLVAAGCAKKKAAVVVPVSAPVAPPVTPAPQPAPQATAPAPVPAPAAIVPTPPPNTATPPPKPAASLPRPAATPAPALGVLLSADQRKQLEIAYQSDLKQASAVLAALAGRTLSANQTDSANRAKAFIKQAGQFHDRDLSTAAELAHRARVLTQELAGSPR